jgi:ABC-type sugar transport system, periplasmic component
MWRFEPGKEDADAWKNVVALWNSQNPDIQVTLETIPWDDYMGPKMTTAFAGDVGPDLFVTSAGDFMDLANNNTMAPVDDIMADVKSDFIPTTIEAASLNGKIVGIPYEMDPLGLFYRKDYLKAAGVEPPKTWDDLLAACKAIKATNKTPLVIETSPGAYQNFTWYPFAWMGGGDVMNADWTASTMRSDAVAAALDLWGTLLREGYAPKSATAPSWDSSQLGRGECAMQINSMAGMAGMKDFPDVAWDICPLPIPAGGQQMTVYGGFQQNVSSRSQHIDAAKKFARWLWVDNKDFVRGWACGFRTQGSPILSVTDYCATREIGRRVDYVEKVLLPIARAEPRFPKEVVQAVSDAIQGVQFAGMSAADAAATAADTVDKFLKTYKGYH